MVKMDDSTLRLNPSGDFTIYQVEELTKALTASFAVAKEVVVNLLETEKIDTAGFQLLVSLQKSCLAAQKKFEIVGISESVKDFMDLLGYKWDFECKGEQ